MSYLTVGGEEIEFQWIGAQNAKGPPIVMLHEGLGSAAMWRNFPHKLAQAVNCPTLVYSRQGYGRSAPLRRMRNVRYLHDEALLVLPELLAKLRIECPILLGHSDGASISLIHAGGSCLPLTGIVVMAPHVIVEDKTITGILATRDAYETTGFSQRLARYHDDTDSVFWGWSDIWLSPDFRSWNIEEYLPNIRCPVLAMQGLQDEYGTTRQLERIAELSDRVELIQIDQCRHSPHRDQPDLVVDVVRRWVNGLRGIDDKRRGWKRVARDRT